jgi:hypothetical protein
MYVDDIPHLPGQVQDVQAVVQEDPGHHAT